MTKSLSDRIADQMKLRQKSARNSRLRNRAAFLALRDDITQAMQDGWPLRVIWETLQSEKRISFGYHAFLRYAKQLKAAETPVSKPAVTAKGPPPASAPDPTKNEPEEAKGPRVGSAELPRFQHNPRVKREDLI